METAFARSDSLGRVIMGEVKLRREKKKGPVGLIKPRGEGNAIVIEAAQATCGRSWRMKGEKRNGGC